MGRASQTRRRLLLALVVAGLVAVIAATVSLPGSSRASAVVAPDPGTAVVLVSGLDSSTPFSSPAPQCAGNEGKSWDGDPQSGSSGPNGVAPALKAAGF